MLLYPDDRLSIVVLSNLESEPVKATACDLASIVFGVEYPRLGLSSPREIDTGYVSASYRSEDGTVREFLFDDGALVYRRGGQDLELSPIDGRRAWRLAAAPEIVFVFHGEGPLADRVRALRTSIPAGRPLSSFHEKERRPPPGGRGSRETISTARCNRACAVAERRSCHCTKNRMGAVDRC